MRILILLLAAVGAYGQISPPPGGGSPTGAAGGDLSGTYPNPATAKIHGTTVPTNSTANQVALTTAAAVTAWTGIPSCQDTVGQHLNFNTTTHAFSCGTSLPTTAVTPGSYTNTSLTVDAQGRLTAASSGAGGTPSSPTTSIQYNNAGAFGGSSNLIYSSGTFTSKAQCTLGTVMFTGTGLDDMTSVGIYVGPEFAYSVMQIVVQIDTTGTPDTFKWSPDGGSNFRGTGVSITGSDQYLENGISIHFAATTGHTLSAEWAFTYSANKPVLVKNGADTTLLGIDANGATSILTQNHDGDLSPIPTSLTVGNFNNSLISNQAMFSMIVNAQNSGSSSFVNAFTLNSENDGTTSSMQGVLVNNSTFTDGALVGDSIGVNVTADYGPGTFTTHSGITVQTPTQDDVTGAIGTLYGLRIKDQSAADGVTTNFNLSSEGALSKNKFAGTVQVNAAAFSTLTACGAGLEGTLKPVNDSTTATWGATITGTGGNHVLAYCNGTNWTVAAK